MGWVLLKRRDLEYPEIILVSGGMYQFSGDSGKWTELARGSDADYDMLLKMAELTGHYVELSVNRNRRHIDELTTRRE